MVITLTNQSRQEILCRSEDENPLLLLPGCSAAVVCGSPGSLRLSLRHRYTSRTEKKWLRSRRYYLVLVSDYLFTGLQEGCTITLTREKICIAHGAYFDRFFAVCSLPAVHVAENHMISGEEELRRYLRAESVSGILLQLPLIFFVFPLIKLRLFYFLLHGIGFFIGFRYGREMFWFFFLALYGLFLLSYLLWKLFDFLLDRFEDTVLIKLLTGHRAVRPLDLRKCFSNEYILRYYSNPHREPYMGGERETE